jgi:hypothetical protein
MIVYKDTQMAPRANRTFHMERAGMAYVIKTEIAELRQNAFTFTAQKTMYGGRNIAKGDVLFLFASENEGGMGLAARGIVSSAAATPRRPGIERQTPRVSVAVEAIAYAKRPLGRTGLRTFSDWKDGRPETELNFKFYRQATNKIGGVSKETKVFLNTFF